MSHIFTTQKNSKKIHFQILDFFPWNQQDQQDSRLPPNCLFEEELSHSRWGREVRPHDEDGEGHDDHEGRHEAVHLRGPLRHPGGGLEEGWAAEDNVRWCEDVARSAVQGDCLALP